MSAHWKTQMTILSLHSREALFKAIDSIAQICARIRKWNINEIENYYIQKFEIVMFIRFELICTLVVNLLVSCALNVTPSQVD